MLRTYKWLLAGLFLGACCWQVALGAGRLALPDLWVVDFHAHVLHGGQEFADLLEVMDRNHVQMAGVSGLARDGSDREVAGAGWNEPDRIMPFLRGFELDRGYSIDYVRNRLASGRFKGIGELFINGHGRRVAGDNPVLMEIYRLAAEYQVPVLIHWTIGSENPREAGTREGYQQLKRALALNASTTFILAHCGKGPPPCRPTFGAILEHLLTRYPNLCLDLSGIQPDLVTPEDTLTELGETVFRLMDKFPTRFLLGFDLVEPANPATQADLTIRRYRELLVGLSRGHAELIGRTNALNLFGRCRNPTLETRREPLRIRGEKGFLPLEYPVPDSDPVLNRPGS